MDFQNTKGMREVLVIAALHLGPRMTLSTHNNTF